MLNVDIKKNGNFQEDLSDNEEFRRSLVATNRRKLPELREKVKNSKEKNIIGKGEGGAYLQNTSMDNALISPKSNPQDGEKINSKIVKIYKKKV